MEVNLLKAVHVPDGFQVIPVRLAPQVERQLGYSGAGRFVAFFYDRDGRMVGWYDGWQRGQGKPGRSFHADFLGPLAALSGKAEGALVMDRLTRTGYLAGAPQAQEFLALLRFGGARHDSSTLS